MPETIHHGDLFDVLPTLDAQSIDACVTDPPYGIGFMGREWDTFKPGTGQTRKLMHPREREAAKIVSDNPNIHGRHRSPALSPSQIDYDYSVAGLRSFQEWTERWAREVHRVLKPGGYIVVCGAPRSYHRMACGLEDAGFVIRDKFSWLFGSGFPKNFNLGDGKGTALKPAHEPIALAWKPFKGTIKACHQTHGTAALNIDACRVGDEDTRRVKEGGRNQFPHEDDAWEPKTVTVGSDMGRWPSNVLLDEVAADALDEMTGELVSGGTPEFRNADKFRNAYGEFKGGASEDGIGCSRGGASRFYLVVDSRDSITHDEECERLRGVIFESQTADGIGSGESREAGESISSLRTDGSGSRPTDEFPTDTKSTIGTTTSQTTPSIISSSSRKPGTTTTISDSGKITSSSTASSSDGANGAGSIAPSQSSLYEPQEPTRATAAAVSQPVKANGEIGTESTTTPTCATTARHGGLAEIIATGQAPGLRFKYCPKPSRAERDMGTHELHARKRDESRKEGNPGGDNPRNRGLQPRGNFHPTVKPVELMRWLVRLVTPENGLVLDPFTGSGTTGMACRYEQRRFIGIEREADYIQIAQARIAAVAPLFAEESA